MPSPVSLSMRCGPNFLRPCPPGTQVTQMAQGSYNMPRFGNPSGKFQPRQRPIVSLSQLTLPGAPAFNWNYPKQQAFLPRTFTRPIQLPCIPSQYNFCPPAKKVSSKTKSVVDSPLHVIHLPPAPPPSSLMQSPCIPSAFKPCPPPQMPTVKPTSVVDSPVHVIHLPPAPPAPPQPPSLFFPRPQFMPVMCIPRPYYPCPPGTRKLSKPLHKKGKSRAFMPKPAPGSYQFPFGVQLYMRPPFVPYAPFAPRPILPLPMQQPAQFVPKPYSFRPQFQSYRPPVWPQYMQRPFGMVPLPAMTQRTNLPIKNAPTNDKLKQPKQTQLKLIPAKGPVSLQGSTLLYPKPVPPVLLPPYTPQVSAPCIPSLRNPCVAFRLPPGQPPSNMMRPPCIPSLYNSCPPPKTPPMKPLSVINSPLHVIHLPPAPQPSGIMQPPCISSSSNSCPPSKMPTLKPTSIVDSPLHVIHLPPAPPPSSLMQSPCIPNAFNPCPPPKIPTVKPASVVDSPVHVIHLPPAPPAPPQPPLLYFPRPQFMPVMCIPRPYYPCPPGTRKLSKPSHKKGKSRAFMPKPAPGSYQFPYGVQPYMRPSFVPYAPFAPRPMLPLPVQQPAQVLPQPYSIRPQFQSYRPPVWPQFMQRPFGMVPWAAMAQRTNLPTTDAPANDKLKQLKQTRVKLIHLKGPVSLKGHTLLYPKPVPPVRLPPYTPQVPAPCIPSLRNPCVPFRLPPGQPPSNMMWPPCIPSLYNSCPPPKTPPMKPLSVINSPLHVIHLPPTPQPSGIMQPPCIPSSFNSCPPSKMPTLKPTSIVDSPLHVIHLPPAPPPSSLMQSPCIPSAFNPCPPPKISTVKPASVVDSPVHVIHLPPAPPAPPQPPPLFFPRPQFMPVMCIPRPYYPCPPGTRKLSKPSHKKGKSRAFMPKPAPGSYQFPYGVQPYMRPPFVPYAPFAPRPMLPLAVQQPAQFVPQPYNFQPQFHSYRPLVWPKYMQRPFGMVPWPAMAQRSNGPVKNTLVKDKPKQAQPRPIPAKGPVSIQGSILLYPRPVPAVPLPPSPQVPAPCISNPKNPCLPFRPYPAVPNPYPSVYPCIPSLANPCLPFPGKPVTKPTTKITTPVQSKPILLTRPLQLQGSVYINSRPAPPRTTYLGNAPCIPTTRRPCNPLIPPRQVLTPPSYVAPNIVNPFSKYVPQQPIRNVAPVANNPNVPQQVPAAPHSLVVQLPEISLVPAPAPPPSLPVVSPKANNCPISCIHYPGPFCPPYCAAFCCKKKNVTVTLSKKKAEKKKRKN